MPLTVLSDRLANWADREPGQDVRISLLHHHLPRMEEAGLIDFDHDAGSVSITRRGKIANEGRKAYLEEITATRC